MRKLNKWLQLGTGIAVIATIIGLSISTSTYKAKTRRLKADIKKSEQVIDSLKKRCTTLENMDAIRVTTTFQIKNVNTLGIQHTGDMQMLAESYASYTRKYILDSLYNKQE